MRGWKGSALQLAGAGAVQGSGNGRPHVQQARLRVLQLLCWVLGCGARSIAYLLIECGVSAVLPGNAKHRVELIHVAQRGKDIVVLGAALAVVQA